MPDQPLLGQLRSSQPRCAYCHDAVDLDAEGAEACARCGTVLHTDCLTAHPACPTLGCGPWRRGPLPKPALAPAQRVRLLAGEARNLVVFLAILTLLGVSAGWGIYVAIRALIHSLP